MTLKLLNVQTPTGKKWVPEPIAFKLDCPLVRHCPALKDILRKVNIAGWSTASHHQTWYPWEPYISKEHIFVKSFLFLVVTQN